MALSCLLPFFAGANWGRGSHSHLIGWLCIVWEMTLIESNRQSQAVWGAEILVGSRRRTCAPLHPGRREIGKLELASAGPMQVSFVALTSKSCWRHNQPTVLVQLRSIDMKPGMTNILLVCANPRGSDPLRTAEEDRTLRESLRLSPNRDSFDVETLNAATIDDLRRALLRKPFNVVHFSGHGTQGGLVFEDAQGNLMVPQSLALAELLQRRGVRVALLNACYSLSVGKISALGLDYTVASTGPISDPGAIEFARGFYDAIGAGTDVPDAYAEGLSSARLKGLSIDAVLLRQGEEYIPKPEVTEISELRSINSISIRSLLGIAIDTSGSMQQSINNRRGARTTRFDEVKAALVDIGAQVHGELKSRAHGLQDSFQIFLYAFGLRVGSGVADMASLWAAAQRIDLNREIQVRKSRYEAEGRSQASQYSGLASLARSYGFGSLVDSVTSAAVVSAREKIVAEVANLVLHEATRIGDTTLTAGELAGLFDKVPVSGDTSLLDQVLFGATPMASAATILRDRFHRTSSQVFDVRTLLLISDGESTDGDPRLALQAIRDSGVNVIACYVTGDDVANPRVLHGAPLQGWSESARLMWEIASPIDETGPAARFLLSNGWSIERSAKLFVQVNHSDVLKEFARMAASHFSSSNATVLPRGQ